MLFGTWPQTHAYDPFDYIETGLYLSLVSIHISRKDRKHRLENIVNIYLSQEIFATDMLRALKSSLKHRKRSLQLYGDQALVTSKKPFAAPKVCKRWKTKSGSCIIFFFELIIKADFLSWQKSLAYSLRIFVNNFSLLSTLQRVLAAWLKIFN